MENVNIYFRNSKIYKRAQWDKGCNIFNIVCGLKSQRLQTIQTIRSVIHLHRANGGRICSHLSEELFASGLSDLLLLEM